MPINVINRQPDPVAERISQAGNSISDTIARKQALQLQAMQYKLQQQNAQTEMEKEQFNRYLQANKVMQDLIDKGYPAKIIMPTMSQFGLDDESMQVLNDLAQHAELVRPQQPEYQKAQEEVKKLQNENKAMEDPGGQLRKTLQGIQSVRGGDQGQPSNAGGFDISGIGLKVGNNTINVENTDFLKKKEQIADFAKTESQLNQVRPMYNSFLNTYNDAVKEMGGLGEDALKAMLEGTSKGIEARLGKLPNVQAYNQSIDSTALNIASYVNRGRPTDPDKNAIMKILPRLTYPAATNSILIRNLDTLLKSPNGISKQLVEQQNIEIVGKAQELIKAAKERKFTPEEINKLLEAYYKRAGY